MIRLFLIIRFLLLFFLFVLSSPSYSNFSCERGFGGNIDGSKLDYVLQVLRGRLESARLYPQHVDLTADRKLVTEWNEAPDMPYLLNFLLPKDVHFIKHQLYQPGDPSTVKLKEPGENALMARAYYTYRHSDGQRYRLGTNVVFSSRALMDNLELPSREHWLVGKNARAAILFLHGGGTKTTGAHAGANMVNHFRKYKIDVLSLDLPWHAQGHREFFDFESEIKVLSSFVKKYVPPNVPLFVWGHSWGGVFAEKLMMMTDRPFEEFSFHNRLRGVIMMSTAVDSAPGKNIREKYEALIQKLHVAKETAKELGAEGERDIFDNIVYQGKFGVGANTVSAATILQLDQSPPSHQGTLYVPGLMLVGTHDSLVYIAWKDLYHRRYENLRNVKAIFVDRATLEVGRERVMTGMGHLLGDFKYPAQLLGDSTLLNRSSNGKSDKEGGSIVQYGEALAFIEEQLKLQDVRNFAYQTVENSLARQITANARETLRRRVQYLPSFDGVREFVDESKVQKLIPPEGINSIRERVNQAESSDPLITAHDPSNKQNTQFVRVTHRAANDLAFRFFLREYLYFSSQVSRDELNRTSIEIMDSIRKILHPFTSPLRRVLYILQKIASNEDLLYDDIGSLMRELDTVISIGHQPRSPISAKLLQDLILLKEELGKDNLVFISRFTQEIIDNNQNVFGNVDMNKIPKKDPPLLVFIFSPRNSLEAVERELKSERISQPIIEEVLREKRKLTIQAEMANNEYIPSKKELEPFFREQEENRDLLNSDSLEKDNSKKRRVMMVLDKLQEVVAEKSGVSQEVSDLRKQLKGLRGAKGQEGEYKVLSDKVAQNIKVIQEGLRRGRTNPPPSLMQEDAKSKEELRRMIEELNKMEDNLTIFAADLKDMSSEDIIRNFNENHREDADHFTGVYLQYVANRQALDKKIITAMEQGEMGKKYQDAVLNIYGPDSKGEFSIKDETSAENGTEGANKKDNLYVELIEFTKDLAVLEAELRRLEIQQVELDVEYNSLMHQLLNLLTAEQKESDSSVGEAVLNRIRFAIEVFSAKEVSMTRLLNGEHGAFNVKDYLDNNGENIDNGNGFIRIRRRQSRGQRRRNNRILNSNKERIVEYIGRHEAVFQEVLKDWKKLTATVPPPLPTAQDNIVVAD